MIKITINKYTSPNKWEGRTFYGKLWVPDVIVCHIAEGTYLGTIAWMQNPKSRVSSHFVVAQDGRVAQMVDLRDTAWCNGTSTNPADSTYYGYATARLVKERKTNANYFTISIENEGFYSRTRGELTPAQLAAEIELIAFIIAEVKRIWGVQIPVDRDHIIGHYEVTPKTKPHCPGERFQWDAVISGVKKKLGGDKVFNDVPSTHWAYQYIKKLKELGIIAGDGAGNFNPDKPATKAEVATMIAKLYDVLKGGK